jgi:hypothetical protein
MSSSSCSYWSCSRRGQLKQEEEEEEEEEEEVCNTIKCNCFNWQL